MGGREKGREKEKEIKKEKKDQEVKFKGPKMVNNRENLPAVK